MLKNVTKLGVIKTKKSCESLNAKFEFLSCQNALRFATLMESDHYVEHNGAAHPLMVSMSHPKYKESILLCISFSYDYTKT